MSGREGQDSNKELSNLSSIQRKLDILYETGKLSVEHFKTAKQQYEFLREKLLTFKEIYPQKYERIKSNAYENQLISEHSENDHSVTKGKCPGLIKAIDLAVKMNLDTDRSARRELMVMFLIDDLMSNEQEKDDAYQTTHFHGASSSEPTTSVQVLSDQSNWDLCLVKSHGLAKWKCINCQDCLCTACKEVHMLGRITKRHRLLHIGRKEKEEELRREIFCSIHENKELDMYCITDHRTICVFCLLDASHAGHETESLETFAERLRSAVGTSLAKADRFYPQIEENLESVREEISKTQQYCDLVKSTMQKAITQMKLNAANLTSDQERKIETFKEKEKDLEAQKEIVKSTLFTSRRFLETCTETELIEQGERYIEILNTIISQEINIDAERLPDQPNRNFIHQQLGKDLFA